MKNPHNAFKAALREGRQQIGLWNMIGSNTVPEMLATCGYDWIVVDTEHTPVDVLDVLPALQATAAYPGTHVAVRPAANDPVIIKRLLDFGAQTLVIPYIQTRAEAEAAVAATRYAPRGIRGLFGGTRASRYGLIADYAQVAEDEICVILQIESALGMANLEEIAAVEGVDGLFIGPADLAASLGHIGQPNHPELVAAIDDIIARCTAMGMPVGLLTLDEAFARRCIGLGSSFTAVGIDMTLLLGAAKALRARF